MSQPGPTGTGVGGTQLSTPGVEALNQPGVDCLQMLQVEVPADGVVFQFTEALGDDRSLGFLPSFRVCEPQGMLIRTSVPGYAYGAWTAIRGSSVGGCRTVLSSRPAAPRWPHRR